MAERVRVRFVGGPTAVVEVGGVRLVTDPTFSGPGEFRSTTGARLVKTAGPAIPPDGVGPVEAVLLSHDQHPDNLDDAGRAYLDRVGRTLTTPAAAARLGGTAVGLAPWASTELAAGLRVTAVPALHGPDGAEAWLGDVTGFVVDGPGVPTVYVSGDNASIDLVTRIATRFAPVHTAVLFAGAARDGVLDDALLTLDSRQAALAAGILQAQHVVPVHFEQWRHLTEGRDALRAAFATAGLDDRLHLLAAGTEITL